MKTKLIVLSLFLYSFTPDVFTTLGVSTKEANSYIFDAAKSNYLQFNTELVEKARSLPVSVQVECARQLVRMAKEYTQSQAFAKAYKKYRNEQLHGKSRGFHIPKPSELMNKVVDKVLDKDTPESALPADPADLVKLRLEEFMKISATVDFDAKTSGNEFLNDKYRAKSNQWKMYFRAGRPVIEAVQAEVKVWLDGIK